MKEKIKTNLDEEEIILAPPTELFDEAKEIAETTTSDQKFPFDIQYNVEQKEFLLSMLQTVGAVVEAEDEKGHTLSTMMNMTQLAFIKRLDCIERVKTDEGTHNPFLAGEGVATETESTPVAATFSLEETVMTADAEAVVASAETASVASVGSRSFSNTDMASAQTFLAESSVEGNICCPDAAKWFKFIAQESEIYTIYTTGSLDTIGSLYDSNGNLLAENDDYAPFGKLNFRIKLTLTAGATYYVKVMAANGATGNFSLKATYKVLAEEVIVQPNEDNVMVLQKGIYYELPRHATNSGEYNYLYNTLDFDRDNKMDAGLDESNNVIYHAPVSVQILPYNTSEKRVSWSASSLYASVSIDTHTKNNTLCQVIRANETGGTCLSVADWNGDCNSKKVYVAIVPVGGSLVKATEIELSDSSLNMLMDDFYTLTATVYPGNATVQNVEWESDNPNVATVTPFGRVKAIAPGTATIRAKAMDGSGVYGCCEVTVNIPGSGTDSIGVFQTLSTLSATPANAETGAPVMLGAQLKELESGNFSVRFVSQIKTTYYKGVGYEIHSKFGDAAPVSNIICTKSAYRSLLAGEGMIYPNEGFDYFVVGVVENVPQNTVASFKIRPFAITLEGEFLYGSTTLFSCKDAQQINSVDFEIPEHLSTSSHLGHAELLQDGNSYTFTCAFSQCNTNFTAPKDQVIGSYVTSDTNPHLGNSQTPLAYGIDVSNNQKEITQSQWNEIANTQIDGHPITFAILRIGIDLADENDIIIGREKDVRFENNYVGAKAAGLHVGCYYYTKSLSTQCAIAAAEQVIEWIGNKQFEYPVFFDIESDRILENVPNKSTRSEICTAFMNKMREAGFFTGLYTNNDWIKNKLDSSMLLPEYDVWYARWYDNTPNNWQSGWAGTGRKFGMWQYTDKKYIPPITVKEVDRNVAYKNYPLIIKALHLNNFK